MAQLELEIESAGDEGRTTLPLPGNEAPASLRFLVGAAAGPGAEITAVRPRHFLASLLLVAGRWVVLAPPCDAALAVNRAAVVGFKVLEHGDVIEVPGLRLRLSEEQTELLVAGARLLELGQSCRICQRAFAPGDRVLYCPVCKLAHHTVGSPQHEDCLSWNGKCASRPFCGYYVHGAQPAAPQAGTP
jgi:hypothetical protein